jgi:hypothetical protein
VKLLSISGGQISASGARFRNSRQIVAESAKEKLSYFDKTARRFKQNHANIRGFRSDFRHPARDGLHIHFTCAMMNAIQSSITSVIILTKAILRGVLFKLPRSIV